MRQRTGWCRQPGRVPRRGRRFLGHIRLCTIGQNGGVHGFCINFRGGAHATGGKGTADAKGKQQSNRLFYQLHIGTSHLMVRPYQTSRSWLRRDPVGRFCIARRSQENRCLRGYITAHWVHPPVEIMLSIISIADSCDLSIDLEKNRKFMDCDSGNT